MGASLNVDESEPTDEPTIIALPFWLNTVAGVNHSGAVAYLQVYELAAAPSGVPLYSYPCDALGTVSEALPGDNARIAGRRLDPGCVVGWSSAPDSWAPVDGTWNLQGQYA